MPCQIDLVSLGFEVQLEQAQGDGVVIGDEDPRRPAHPRVLGIVAHGPAPRPRDGADRCATMGG